MKEYQIGDFVYIAWGYEPLRKVQVQGTFADEDGLNYILRAPSGIEECGYYVREYDHIADEENGPLHWMANIRLNPIKV